MILDRDEVPEERQVARLLKQILDGIAFLHSLNVAHLDIKVNVFKHSKLRLYGKGGPNADRLVKVWLLTSKIAFVSKGHKYEYIQRNDFSLRKEKLCNYNINFAVFFKKKRLKFSIMLNSNFLV